MSLQCKCTYFIKFCKLLCKILQFILLPPNYVGSCFLRFSVIFQRFTLVPSNLRDKKCYLTGFSHSLIFLSLVTKSCSLLYFVNFFLLLFKYGCLHSPHSPSPAPPIPTSHSQSYPPLALSMCLLYMFLNDLTPSFPRYHLPLPLWLLSVFSLFQCLWLYFACLFVLLIRFHL